MSAIGVRMSHEDVSSSGLEGRNRAEREWRFFCAPLL